MRPTILKSKNAAATPRFLCALPAERFAPTCRLGRDEMAENATLPKPLRFLKG
jgi:hypothetical protein